MTTRSPDLARPIVARMASRIAFPVACLSSSRVTSNPRFSSAAFQSFASLTHPERSLAVPG